MKKQIKRCLSVFMVLALMIGVVTPVISAEDIITHVVDIYANGAPVTTQVSMMEGDTLQLTPTLIDCSMPTGGYFYWESETPILVSVDQNGLVRAHDSSKGAVLRLWVDNNIRTIPIVGDATATAIYALFTGMDIDAMDADGILNVIQAGASVLPSALTDSLIASLRTMLNTMDTGITVILYDVNGVELARDQIRVVVTKSTAITADFFPNGTTITNKAQVPSTVEVGYTMQLQAVTTPMRLHMGVTWTVKSGSSATLSDTGLATFTSPGDVTLMASPDVKGFMDNVIKYAALVGNDPETVAGTLASVLSTLGVPISTTIMKYVLWGLLYVVGTGNAISWSEGAITTVANYLLQLSTNDTVTVHVVDNLPIQSFTIAGTTSVQEGATQQLAAANLVPKGATTQGIVWQSSNTNYIGIGSSTGLMIGRDAGSNSGSKSTTVSATLDGVTVSTGATVTGKNLSAVSEVEITGPSVALIGVMTQMIAKTYPSRLIPVITWGIVADDGKTEVFATTTTAAENSLARINKNGILTPLEGGTVTIIAKTSDTVKTYYKVFVGTLVTGVALQEAPNVAVSVPLSQSYKDASATLHAIFTPADATNQTIIWSSSSSSVSVDASGVCKPTANSSCYAVITATTQDGGFKASCVVSFANYPVTGISLDKTSLSLHEGGTSKITETITPAGFLSMGAASIKDVIWTSSNTNVATVSGGTVTAVHPGDAVITATTVDGFKTATCTVSVRADKTALNHIINLVTSANLDPNNYPPDDFAALTQALQQAITIQNLDLATQAQCDNATQYLASNFDALNQYKPLRGITLTFNGTPAPDYETYKVGLFQIYSNQSLQFSYTLTPADANYKSITWSSSNSAMNIDQTGKCGPNSNNATWSVITVRAEDFLGNVYTDSVGVAFANVPVTGISLNTTSVGAGLVHNTTQLTATVTPTGTPLIGADITDVQWISGDPNVVTVSDSGLMTYVGPGSTTVYAKTRDGGFTATCTVTVFINKTLLKTALDTVNNANLNYAYYTPTTWNALLVAMARAQQVYDNPDAIQADVDSATTQLNSAYSGLVKYIYVNSVTIYNGDNPAGDFISKNVTVLQNYTNQSIDLTLRMSPLDSYYESIVWSSSSSTVSVDQNGVCKPTSNAACFALITVSVTTYYGRTVTDSVYVSFANNSATRVDVTPTTINASVGNAPQNITYVVKSVGTLGTVNATLQNVIWSSDNPNIPVTQSGQVSFLNAGAATITVTSVDGGVYGTCSVVVSGDKTALSEALAFIDAQHVNVQDYEITTSNAFSAAYNTAIAVYNGVTYSQEQIDAATAALYSTYQALKPYIHMTALTILKDGNPAPSHVSVKVQLYQIYSNQSVQFTSTFAPSNAMYTSIVWSSNDSSITVDQTGKCKPSSNAAGGALISLTATDHYGNKMVDTVFVAFANYQVTGMTIDKTSLTATVGAAPVTITSSFTPTGIFGASFAKTYWSSSNPAVATVSQSGVVTYVDAGQCVITATSYDGDYTRTCPVTVYADKVALVNAINAIVSFAPDPALYTPASWAVFAAALNSAIAVRDTVFAKQADVNAAKVALLSAFDGLVAYVYINSVAVTYSGAMTNGYVTKSVPLTSTYQSQSIQLGYALFPADATINTIVWSSNTSSISVDQTGLCTPTANSACRGIITVTATDYKGNVRQGSINVAFANYPVTGVSVSPSSITNAVNGGTATITASVTPAGTLGIGAANFKDVIWSSSDESIATVTSGGVVTFINSGTVSITTTTVDGGFSASCAITVSANKTALLNAVNTLSTLTQTSFTPASWTAMMAVYNASNAVYNNALASQADVDAATANLLAAYQALVPYVYISSAAVSVGGVNQHGYVIVHVPSGSAYTAASATLGILFDPLNAMYANIAWSSSSPNISVTQSGVVKATVDSPCFATLTATVTDHFGNTYKASAVVAFVKVAAASLTVSPTTISAAINSGTVQLTATMTGENGQTPDFSGIVWSSTNPSVASVDQNGLVTIGIGGVAYVTASTQIGELRATCTVTVKIDKTPLANIINAVMQANYNPLDYSAASFAALSSALTAARSIYANPDSDQTSINQATAALTAARDGLVPRSRITSITITPNSDFISKKVELYQTYNSQSIQLGVTINPTAGEYTSLVWSSSASSVTVDQTGKCTPSANSACTAIITVTATDSFGKVFTDSVTVAFANYQVTGVTLSSTSLAFFLGDSAKTLTPTIAPVGVLGVGSASVKSVTWVSSNPDVATVSSAGAVSAVHAGTAVITCRTDDGGKTAACTVTVSGPKITAVSGSHVTVDGTRKYIYGIPEGTTNLNAYLTTPYGSLVFTPTDFGYGTGTKVDLVYNGNVIDTYYLVIFGDANGDGYANGSDAMIANLAASYMVELTAIETFALDVNGDGIVNSVDSGLLDQVGLFLHTIDQTHPY